MEWGPDQHEDEEPEGRHENVPQLGCVTAEKVGEKCHDGRVTKIGFLQNLSHNRLFRHKYSVFINQGKYSARN
jgi:hypothetical protein